MFLNIKEKNIYENQLKTIKTFWNMNAPYFSDFADVEWEFIFYLLGS